VRLARLAIVAGLVLLCAGLPARAEVNGEGDLVVSFDGGFVPTQLPRGEPAPVAVHVAGDIRSASGLEGSLPQLRTISVAINRQGRLFDRGLPVCDVASIQPAGEAEARAVCGDAIIGNGHVTVQVRIPGQLPFAVQANLLVFNGTRRGGHKLILAQAYTRDPPGAFVLTFVVSHHEGIFGTRLRTTLPRSAHGWAYLTYFGMTLHRVFEYAGARRSYVSAACSAPRGFRSALFPFAKATYEFDDGQRLTTSVARRCSVLG
jgi:hypothetical protein